MQTVRKAGQVVGYRAVLRTDGKAKYGPLVQDRALARSALLEKLQRETGTVLPGEPFSTSVRNLLDGRLRKEWAEATRELGESVFSRLDWMGALPASGIGQDDVLRWRVSIDVKPSTAHRYQRIVEVWLSMLGNPVKAPKPRVREPEARILDRSEQQRFLDACKTQKARSAMTLFLETGVRPGELCGLKFSDVHEGGFTIERDVDAKGKPGLLKTDRSRRWVPVSKDTLDLLGTGKGYVLGTKRGTPMNTGNFRRMVLKIAKDAKLGHVTPMDVRHTVVVNMLSAGASPPVVARITGHSLEMCMKVYWKATLDEMNEANRKTQEWRKTGRQQ